MKRSIIFLLLFTYNNIDAQRYYEKYFDSGIVESGASVIQFGNGSIAVSGFSQRNGSPITGMTLFYNEFTNVASFQFLNSNLRSQFPLIAPIDNEFTYFGGVLARTGADDSWILYQMNENGVINPFLEEGELFFDHTLREAYALQDRGVMLTGGSSSSKIGMMARYSASGNQTWQKGLKADDFRIFLGDMEQIGSNYFVSGSLDDTQLNWTPLIISVSPSGDLLWNNEYKLPAGVFTSAGISPIAVTDDGNFVIVYQLVIDRVLKELLLMKISPGGDVLWSRRVDAPGNLQLGGSLQKLDNDGFLVVGTHRDDSGNSTGFLFEFDIEGDIRWANTYGHERDASLVRAVLRKNGEGILATGYGTPCNQTSRDVYLLSLNRQGEGLPSSCGVEEISLSVFDFDVEKNQIGQIVDYQSRRNTLPGFTSPVIADVYNVNCSTLDLDGDDSSGAIGNDFSQTIQCFSSEIHISDEDLLYQGNGNGIDSIVVRLISSVNMDSLGYIGSPGVSVSASGRTRLVFTDLDRFNNIEMAGLFSSTVLFPFDTIGTRRVLITIYTNCGESLLAESISVLELATNTIIDLGAEQRLCSGDSIKLDATVSDGLTYRWAGGQETPAITILNGGTYYVTVTDTCDNERVGSVTVIQESGVLLNVLDTNFEIMFCEGDTLDLDATVNGADSYSWLDGRVDPQIKAVDTGIYEVIAKNACDSVTITYSLVSENCCKLYLPNAFSPDNNGVNDNFKAFFALNGCGNINAIVLKIYDRWGGEIFVGNGLTGWNGRGEDGAPASQGVYTYILTYNRGAIADKKVGTVSLIK